MEEMEVKESLKSNLLVPIKEGEVDGFKVYYYDIFASLLEDSEALGEESKAMLKRYLGFSKHSFRLEINFKGVNLLVAYFFTEKCIRIGTPRLNTELFLLQELEDLKLKVRKGDDVFKYCHKEKYDELKSYTEKIMSLNLHEFPSVFEARSHRYDFNHHYERELEQDTAGLVKKLLPEVNKYSPTSFEKISDFSLNLTARYALLRVHILKFLAILPSLDFDERGVEVKRILLESIRRLLADSERSKFYKVKGEGKALPGVYIFLFNLTLFVFKKIPAGLLAKMIRSSVKTMARRFIAGETIDTATVAINALSGSKRDVTLDQLGELVVSEKEADHYCNEVLKLINGFSQYYTKGEKNAAGVNRAHVSIKVSALCSDFKPQAFDYTYELVAPRLKKILLQAHDQDVFINIDAEHYHYRDSVFEIYKKVLLETPELQNYAQTGIVIQAYLRDAFEHLEDIKELAKARGLTMPVRLVKGAYWDAETIEAVAHGFDAPEFLNKEETDLNFRQILIKIMEAHPNLSLCLASHNFSDHCFAEALRNKHFKDLPAIEHQCLHMTYEALSVGMANLGWVVRNYVPIGSLLVGMAYLVRRIMENSSQVGVLTIMRSHKKLKSIQSALDVHEENKREGLLNRDLSQYVKKDFFNISTLRMYVKDEREAFLKDFETFKKSLGQNYANSFLLNGDEQKIVSNSDPDTLVGTIKLATKEDCENALKLAHDSYNEGLWSNDNWFFRVSCLVRAANIMYAKRNELSSLIVYEAGKTIEEALGDVDEAIDFLNFYAREEARLQQSNKRPLSIGPIAVIAPWNFPLAIPCGMTVSSLVAGNTVLLKSAGQTPLISQALVDILHQAGVPNNVLIHLPGSGRVVGQTLVESEKIAGIVFTGSKAVGMNISKIAARRFYKNQLHNLTYPVKVISEMGGKNAIIVTANAELDETVAGILYSAFGHSGQKCSAASRVIVDNQIKDRLIERLREATLDIKAGKAYDLSTSINPLVTKGDKERIQNAAIESKAEVEKYGGKIIVDRSQEDLPGYCVGPVLVELPIERVLDDDSLAKKELFGPFVHIIGYRHMDEAIKVFNGTEYALTGGIFSQSQDDIDHLSKKLEAGNIYINRSITGARVAIEPFGGFKLSGTGPKAGGRSYVNSFHLYRYQDVEPAGTPNSSGSDYIFDLCEPSKLMAAGRHRRMKKATDLILKNFEMLYPGIHGNKKKIFEDYNDWFRSDSFLNFHLLDHDNRKIPGQLSYSNYHLNGEHVAVVTSHKQADFKTFLYTLSALAVGSGVTIMARNDESYNWWMIVRNFLVGSGISKQNFDVFLPSEERVLEVLKSDYLSSVIIDSDEEEIKKFNEIIFDNSLSSYRMTKILTPYNGPKVDDFEEYCLPFIWERAFAINTMRHGAPLSLEINESELMQ